MYKSTNCINCKHLCTRGRHNFKCVNDESGLNDDERNMNLNQILKSTCDEFQASSTIIFDETTLFYQ